MLFDNKDMVLFQTAHNITKTVMYCHCHSLSSSSSSSSSRSLKVLLISGLVVTYPL